MTAAVTIRNIALLLMSMNLIPENVGPSYLIKHFNNISTINMTKSQKDIIGFFFNETMPCLVNISQKYFMEPNITQYNRILSECFFIEPTPEKAPCDDVAFEFLTHFTMFVFSVVILIIFSCCIQRRRHACVTCCYGLPGPVVPLNMLDSYENRKGYMLAFGVIVTSIVFVLVGDNYKLLGKELGVVVNAFTSRNSYASIFVKIFLSLYVAIINYPLFVAQNIHNKLIGSILGIFISATWLGMNIFKFVAYSATCFIKDRQERLKDLPIIKTFYDVPKIICLFLLLIKFIYVLLKTCSHRRAKQRQGLVVDWLYGDDTDWREEYMYVHVKEVFKKHLKEDSVDENLSFTQKLFKRIRSMLYEKKIGFQYSTRIIISIFVSILAVYLIMISITIVGYTVFTVIWDQIFSSETVQAISSITRVPLTTIKDYVNAFKVSYWLALALAILFCVIVTMNQLMWYRRHILMLRRGDRSFLPNSIRKGTLDPGTLMTASFKFAGFQVGFSVWGFILSYVVFLIASYVVITQLFLPMVRKELSILLILLIKLWPNILLAIAMIIIQRLIASKIFLHDNETLAVDNRRAYHIASYFFFYFNVLLGLVSCLLRIILGMILGVIFMQRLSKSTLPRSYERRDPGYLAYLGFILLEHQHSNPVLQCFARLLLETQNIDLKDEFFSNPNAPSNSVMEMMKLGVNVSHTEKERERRRRKAIIRNRWNLYTVMSLNPSIIKYRIRFLDLKKPKKEKLFDKFSIGFLNSVFNKNDSQQENAPTMLKHVEDCCNNDEVNSDTDGHNENIRHQKGETPTDAGKNSIEKEGGQKGNEHGENIASSRSKNDVIVIIENEKGESMELKHRKTSKKDTEEEGIANELYHHLNNSIENPKV